MYRIISFVALITCIVWLSIEPGFEPIIASLVGIGAFFRDEIHGVIGFKVMSLVPRASLIRNLINLKYSFTHSEYINPRIIEDLLGWLSDSGDQIVEINLTKSNNSNRYFGQITAEETTNHPIVKSADGETSFAYQYIGCSFSGVHLLRTWSYSGGTGVFCSVILVTISNDTAIDYDNGKIVRVNRLVIKKLGALPLGDRYEGDVTYRLGFLCIPACKGRNSLRNKKTYLLVL